MFSTAWRLKMSGWRLCNKRSVQIYWQHNDTCLYDCYCCTCLPACIISSIFKMYHYKENRVLDLKTETNQDGSCCCMLPETSQLADWAPMQARANHLTGRRLSSTLPAVNWMIRCTNLQIVHFASEHIDTQYAHGQQHKPVWRCVQTRHIAGTGPASASSWSRSGALCSLSVAAHSRYLMKHKINVFKMFFTVCQHCTKTYWTRKCIILGMN